MENYRRKKQQSPNILMIVMIVVFVAVIITAAVLLIKSLTGSDSDGGRDASSDESVQDMYDPDAEKGALEGRDTRNDEEDPDQFSYVINTEPEFKNAKSAGDILIENPAHNKYLMRVEIEDEDGELLYSSGYIRPGWHINSIKLQRKLEKGEHYAQACIYAYDKDSKDVVTMAYQELALIILK